MLKPNTPSRLVNTNLSNMLPAEMSKNILKSKKKIDINSDINIIHLK